MPTLRTIWFQARIVALLLLQAGYFTVQAHAQPTREYRLKAIFLFNFTQFVDWPSGIFETDKSPFVIGVLGDNPFGSYLDEAVSGETINGHPLVIHYFRNQQDVKTCHILYVNLPETKQRKEAMEGLKGKDILTVSDASDFMAQGGMIRLLTLENKIKLQVNLEACRASKLVLSSKLLRLAEIFDAKGKI
ncbi:MAG: YfiR family protein [Bacteroidota bacterium]|nr:YfiR family protein [Bacteroidota bacterium]MDP4218636.1 YfiR family protein [Bacteroidota bacterium]MDP4246769.1 YfiR family protein [Bacteroidota bacterium]MDP4259599.1 YfiR family protein [Bacteroidota bacterium]